MQTDATLLTNNSQHCRMLHVASAVACCWMLLLVVAQSLKPVELFSQQLPTFLLFRDRRNVAQRSWIRLHRSSNIVGATHAHYAWLQRLIGCILPTMHCRSQRCWELLHSFAHHCQHARSLRYNVREINLRNIFQHFFKDLLHLL